MRAPTVCGMAFVALAIAGGGRAGSIPRRSRTCGTVSLPEKETAASEARLRLRAASRAAGLRAGAGATREAYRELMVPVRFVVIHDGDEGDVAQSRLEQQVQVLNDAYSGAGADPASRADSYIRFTLHSVVRPDNREDFGCDYAGDSGRAFKTKYVAEPERLLNVISCQNSDGILGWSPIAHTNTDEGDAHEAVVVDHRSMPGGTLAWEYGLGATAVHEIGHFFGLLHTFAGGCGPNDGSRGDFVFDTPAQSEPTFGCPVGRDSCPQDGLDPIHNYMDYSDDHCMDSFTPGQVERMRTAIETFRPIAHGNWLDTTGPPIPTRKPTAFPTTQPTAFPTPTPTRYPTHYPTRLPTRDPTAPPTSAPSAAQTPAPTAPPTIKTTRGPNAEPTLEPTAAPSLGPTQGPSDAPTPPPTPAPTAVLQHPGCTVGLQPAGYGIVASAFGFDLPNQPLEDRTLAQCRAECLAIWNCAAFSWKVGLPAPAIDDCYLKRAGFDPGHLVAGPATASGSPVYTTYIVDDGACVMRDNGAAVWTKTPDPTSAPTGPPARHPSAMPTTSPSDRPSPAPESSGCTQCGHYRRGRRVRLRRGPEATRHAPA